MKRISYLCAFFALLSVSCNKADNELSLNNEPVNRISIHGESATLQNGVLRFETNASFENALEGIKRSKIVVAKSADGISTMGRSVYTPVAKEFRSLYDVYIDAMNEAKQYYDTQEGYEQFKKKYSTLYFPEQENDYSAFLPVSDKELAKVLNPQGEIMIGDSVYNMNDITSFQQLKDLGWTMPEATTATRATITSPTMNKMNDVYDNTRKYKMWVNVTRESNSATMLEVCFRSKGFLGIWYNYSSTTMVNASFRFQGPAGHPVNGQTFSYNGGLDAKYSSHDYYINNYGLGPNGPLAFAKGYMDIRHWDFNGTVHRVNFDMN